MQVFPQALLARLFVESEFTDFSHRLMLIPQIGQLVAERM